MSGLFKSKKLGIATFIAVLFAFGVAAAADEPISAAMAYYAIDNLGLLAAAILVLAMQPGFALLEAGLNPARNTVHCLFKNTIDLTFGLLLYFFVGYGLMYGTDIAGGFLGWGGFGIPETDPTKIGPGILNPQVDWLFQAVFAATAATIVGGAVAGRMNLHAYSIYTVIITAVVYPISGFWKWGGGWLDQLGFYDFAGSLVVHSVGGFAALAAVITLGARKGRFNADGSSNRMPGSSIVLSALGVFILWIGWYGFNPGSQLAFSGSLNTNATLLIAVNTTLSAAAGGVIALWFTWLTEKKPQLLSVLNGILAGLVGITANCDSVTNVEAIIIGAVAGVLVVLGARLLEKFQLDDAVGAFPVHGLCGIWGGLAAGIFGGHPLGAQIIGSIAIPLWAFSTMFALFLILKKFGILRVSESMELAGLDLAEHGEVEDGSAFDWKAEYSMHIPGMDAQHQKLLAIAKNITEASRSDLGESTVRDNLDQLVEYTQTHFRDEEEYMAKINFPGLEEHKQVHKKLTEQALKYKETMITNPDVFQNFMADWLIVHILHEDRKYAQFSSKLNSK